LKSIFVGNLPFSTTEDDLRVMFEPYGSVGRVSVMTDRDTGRSRGFGFVEMNDDNEAEAAIAAMNGHSMGGRALNVNEARPRPERGGFSGGEGRGGTGGPGGAGGRGGRSSNKDDYRGHARQPREPRW
jgi:RNA recognition motif-containing protein